MNWINLSFGEDRPCSTSSKINALTDIQCMSDKGRTNVVEDVIPLWNWIEIYKPTSSSELVVNRTKIKELENWIDKSMKSKSTSKLLLITGPSGCGKTITLHTICKDLNIKVNEWLTPLDRHSLELDNPFSIEFENNPVKLFKEHIFRSARYKSCLVANTQKHIVLVKDFPNVFVQSPSKFQDILESISGKVEFPVVFICNSLYSKELFPSSVKRTLGVQTITLNAVSEKNVEKALKNVIFKMSDPDDLNVTSLQKTIHEISQSCQGDLRTAIGLLNLKYIDWSQLNSHRRKFSMNNLSSSKMVTRDKKLDFFHGIGRVLYPKQIESAEGLKFVHSAESIVENFQSETGGFLSQLHKNYPGRMMDLGSIAEAAGRLATSDLLKSRWQERDIFNHYSLAVAVRGLMVANKTPRKTGFQGFRKSHTSRMEVDNKAIELEGKMLFSELAYTRYDSLVDVFPYSELLMSNMSKDQRNYVRKTCVFNNPRCSCYDTTDS